MNEDEIASPADIDTALSANALRKHAKLWKAAEGRAFSWTEALGALCAALLLISGTMNFGEDQATAMVQIAIALAILPSIMLGRVQKQVTALTELVKRLEAERPLR